MITVNIPQMITIFLLGVGIGVTISMVIYNIIMR
jgi:hypothetical protein